MAKKPASRLGIKYDSITALRKAMKPALARLSPNGKTNPERSSQKKKTNIPQVLE